MGFLDRCARGLLAFWQRHWFWERLNPSCCRPQVRRLSKSSPQPVCDKAIKSLARLLGFEQREVEQQITSWHTHNWQNDVHSLGAYSYGRVGSADAAVLLNNPIANTLFLAGEHCDTGGHNGTVHGSMASGRAAARQALAALQR